MRLKLANAALALSGGMVIFHPGDEALGGAGSTFVFYQVQLNQIYQYRSKKENNNDYQRRNE